MQNVKINLPVETMGDPGNYFYSQDRQYREQPMPRDDFTSFAEANANYCYQLSLWWWNAVYNQQHAATQSWYNRFTDQSCECAERTMTVEGECDCCQNNACFDYERHEIHACKDCPESESYVGPYWHRLHGEHSSVNGNHHGATFSPNVNENSIISHNTDETGEYDDSSGDDGDDDDGNINSSDDDDDSDTNMEVDENFRKFLEQSEKHRQERERSKFFLADVNYRGSFPHQCLQSLSTSKLSDCTTVHCLPLKSILNYFGATYMEYNWLVTTVFLFLFIHFFLNTNSKPMYGQMCKLA